MQCFYCSKDMGKDRHVIHVQAAQGIIEIACHKKCEGKLVEER